MGGMRIHMDWHTAALSEALKKRYILTRVNYTSRWEALLVSCEDIELTYNEWRWSVGMSCALYIELLAHSSMSNEEYHFKASASGLVYIMASMLWEGMLRGGWLCIAFPQMEEYYSNTIFASS